MHGASGSPYAPPPSAPDDLYIFCYRVCLPITQQLNNDEIGGRTRLATLCEYLPVGGVAIPTWLLHWLAELGSRFTPGDHKDVSHEQTVGYTVLGRTHFDNARKLCVHGSPERRTIKTSSRCPAVKRDRCSVGVAPPPGNNTLTPLFANDVLSLVDLCNNVPMSSQPGVFTRCTFSLL